MIIKFPYVFLILLLSIGVNTNVCSQYSNISINELELNKNARKLNSAELSPICPAKTGFIWDEEDNTTPNYRPQGVTTINTSNRKFIAVSWYGRKQEGFENRGARISFVDITSMDSISYCHVLLVDENYNTLSGIHAGGLLFKSDTLYIPDTRKNYGNNIYGFALSDLQKIPSNERKQFYEHHYILKRSTSVKVPIRPDCISYDWDSDDLLIASFRKRCVFKFTFNPRTTFSWFKKEEVSESTPFHKGFFDEVQGIAAMNHPTYPHQKIMWASSSYGRKNQSFLYATHYTRNPNNSQGQKVDYSNLHYVSYPLPAGTEDLHLEEDNKTLWTLTEFTPHEGKENNRIVFAFSVEDVLPE